MMIVKAQRGMSLGGGLLMLVVVGFLASTAFKVIPHYMDYSAMKKVIVAAQQDRSQPVSNPEEFYSRVQRGMSVNSVQDLDLRKALSLTRESDGFRAHLQYERREPLVGNLDLVMKFDHDFLVGAP